MSGVTVPVRLYVLKRKDPDSSQKQDLHCM